ncbi:MAG: hypothetical protein ACKVPX_18460 [Myxococcaceae bacterium]
MNPEELEARADRARRRGEVSEALMLYRQLAEAFPGEARYSEKVALLSENLQPFELQSPRTAMRPVESFRSETPQQEGERLFTMGDFAGAAAAYRRALHDQPGNQLVRERLEELYRLALVAPRVGVARGALPADPEARLKAVLDRIASRRRIRKGA